MPGGNEEDLYDMSDSLQQRETRAKQTARGRKQVMEVPLKITRANAFDQANVWSKIWFTWMIPLFNRGYCNELTLDDLYTCSVEDDPKTHADALEW